MMWPPSVLRLRVHSRRHHFGLWLPLFLIWPLIVVLSLLLLPLALALVIILWRIRWLKPVLLAGPCLLSLVCALRGLEVDVRDGSEQFFISFR